MFVMIKFMFLFSSLQIVLLCYPLLNTLSIIHIFYNLFQILFLHMIISYLLFFFFIYILKYMDPSHTLINHMTSNKDAYLVNCITIHTILHGKKYFSKLTLAKFNVNTKLGLFDLIQGFERTIIILPSGTKIYINDALYSFKSN